MENDIKIGSKVKLLYWRNNELVDGEVVEILLERYLFDYKTIVKVEFYVKSFGCWVIESYYINDFIEAMKKAQEAMKKAQEVDNKS